MADPNILFSGAMIRALLAGRKVQTRRLVDVEALAEIDRFVKVGTETASGRSVFEMKDRNGCHVSIRAGKHSVTQQFLPRIAVGDLVWVKENHAIVPRSAYRMSEGVQQTLKPDDDHDAAVYAAGWERSKPGNWRPSIHMPRWASRLTLDVTDVRIQRLQDISEADARDEGIIYQNVIVGAHCYAGHHVEVDADRYWNGTEPETFEGHESAVDAFADLWDFINAKPTPIKGENGKTSHYVSYPWSGQRRVEVYRGKAHHITPNPFVVAYTFRLIKQNIDTIERSQL